MKENVRKYIVLEVIVFPGLLHIVLLITAEYFCRRYQLNRSYISALSYCLVLIMLFWLHEFIVKMTKENVESMKDFYIYI